MTGLEALIAKGFGSGLGQRTCASIEKAGSVLEGNTVLSNGFEAGFPDESDIAGGCCLEPPGEEGGDSITAD